MTKKQLIDSDVGPCCSTDTKMSETTQPIDSRTSDGRPLIDHIRENKLWGQIRRAAKTNPGLQDLLDHVIMFYQLSKHK